MYTLISILGVVTFFLLEKMFKINTWKAALQALAFYTLGLIVAILLCNL